MTRARCIHLDGRVEDDCQENTLLDRLQQGQLVILPDQLQELQLFDQLGQLILACIEQSCGSAAAAQVEQAGLEKIHLHLDVDRMEEVYALVRSELALKMPAVTAEMFRRIGAEEPFYVHSASLIRLMVPYGCMQQHQRRLQKHPGKLALHPPHHDHYQNVPTNAINTWIAMAPVSRENGMFIYPEVWGKNLPRESDRPAADQYLGHPIAIEMQPGDALLFHSHHMHASRLNTTVDTRIVLTNRVCLGKPKYPDPLRPQRYFLSSAFEEELDLGQVFSAEGFVGNPAKTHTSGLQRRALAAIRKLGLKWGAAPPETPNLKKIGVYPASGARRDPPEGEIFIVDDWTCATRINEEVLLFQRHCPHEGADLALGFIENGRVVCPWHGLQFCPATGASNCDAVPPLRTGERR